VLKAGGRIPRLYEEKDFEKGTEKVKPQSRKEGSRGKENPLSDKEHKVYEKEKDRNRLTILPRKGPEEPNSRRKKKESKEATAGPRDEGHLRGLKNRSTAVRRPERISALTKRKEQGRKILFRAAQMRG